MSTCLVVAFSVTVSGVCVVTPLVLFKPDSEFKAPDEIQKNSVFEDLSGSVRGST